MIRKLIGNIGGQAVGQAIGTATGVPFGGEIGRMAGGQLGSQGYVNPYGVGRQMIDQNTGQIVDVVADKATQKAQDIFPANFFSQYKNEGGPVLSKVNLQPSGATRGPGSPTFAKHSDRTAFADSIGVAAPPLVEQYYDDLPTPVNDPYTGSGKDYSGMDGKKIMGDTGSNAAWGLYQYGSSMPIPILPGQMIANTVGGAMLDQQIDAIDQSFTALDAPPGKIAVSDEDGNIYYKDDPVVEMAIANQNAYEKAAGISSSPSKSSSSPAPSAPKVSTYSHSTSGSDDSGNYTQHYYDSDHDWSQPTETRTYESSSDSGSDGGKP